MDPENKGKLSYVQTHALYKRYKSEAGSQEPNLDDEIKNVDIDPKDGKISDKELKAYLQDKINATDLPLVESIFKEMDDDKDMKLTYDQYKKAYMMFHEAKNNGMNTSSDKPKTAYECMKYSKKDCHSGCRW